MRLIFKHTPSATNPNSVLAHQAALAAGAEGKFWDMHDLLFANQRKLARSDLLDHAKQLGLDLMTFRQALDNQTYQPIVERDLAEAKALGVATTPTVFINGRRMVGPQGYAAVQAVIDSVLAGIPRRRSLPTEVIAPGPAQEINLEHAPAKGPAAAPVSVVEFSDFECPFCAEVVPVVRELLKAYPTQVRLSFKHFPLPFHKHAALAHEAALAAGEQGKFWEMHDLLFAGQGAMSHEDLVSKAKELNLDMPRFLVDLDSRRFKAVVEADRKEGDRLGVDGTPFFFINGHALSGAGNLAEFKHLLDTALKEAAPAAPK